jgi:hypothetical protein
MEPDKAKSPVHICSSKISVMKNFRGLLFRTLLVISLITVLIFKMNAQIGAGSPVKVAINVLPPYSTNAKDYIQQGNNVMITLTNMSSIPQQVIVLPSISGNNGVKASLRSNYQPPAGLLLAPSQVRTLTLNQLKTVNSTVTANDIIVEKMTKDEYLNNTAIPEGLYTVCATVKNFAPTVTFEEQACATFVINSYDPPIILNPVANASVKPLSPQFVNFGWTPSGVAGKTRYQLKLVDLTTSPVNNPNDAFENNNIQPFFQQTNILTNNFILDNGKPKLKEGNKYALQVVAFDPQNKLLYKNKGRSQVIVFTYKGEMGLANTPAPNNPNNPQDDPSLGPCVATTKWQGTLNTNPKDGLPSGTEIAIGKFVIRNTSFTKTGGGYDGTGEITVNFLKTKLKVEFKSLLVNGENRAYNGVVTAKVVNNSVIPDAMSKQKQGSITTVPNITALSDYLDADARNVAKLSTDKPAIDLPVHIDKNKFAIGVVGFIFEPTEAYMNAVLNMPLITAAGDDNYLLLSRKAIPVHPNGYKDAEVKLLLMEDRLVQLSNKLGLDFNSGDGNTFASFDCEGFKKVTIKGDVVLSRGAALPLNSELAAIADEASKLRFPFEFEDVENADKLIKEDKELSKRFSIPDASDFAFEVKGIILDLSSTMNHADFDKAYPEKKNKKDWVGVYIKSMKLNFPEGFKKKEGGRMSVEAENAYIDKMGFTTKLVVGGKTFATGIIAQWGITLEEVSFEISQSKLTGAGFGGTIMLPLGDKFEMGYEASVSKGEHGANVSLEVETKKDLEANFFLAKMALTEGSTVEIGKEDNKYFAKASLNGELSISIKGKKANSNVGKLDIPSIKFEELTIEGRDDVGFIPQMDIKSISLQNENGVQAKLGGFELNLNNLKFTKNKEKKEVSLSIDMGMSLFGGANDAQNGVGAKTNFAIYAKHDGSKYKYDRAELKELEIKADLGVAILSGSVAIYDEDEVYGNGFRGNVSASLTGLGVGIDVTLQFGRTLESKGDYKYWYFDAMVDFGKVGLNIPGTAASIYGFGGGAYCNMTRNGGKDVIKPGEFKEVKSEGSAPTKSGVKMTPQLGIAGFKAAVLFGITGSREAFNGDLTFSMELNYKTLSVNEVELKGNAYVMQAPENPAMRDPDKAMVHCFAEIKYNAPTRVISGNFGAEIKVLKIIEGGGTISFKFDLPDRDKNGNVIKSQGLKWYIKVGQWSPGVDPFEDKKRLYASIGFDAKVLKVEVTLQGYFMVGNDLPSGLPPLPDYIYAVTASKGAPAKKDLPASVSNTQGLAFAFGAGIKLYAGFDIKIVAASVEAAAGFDVLISDLNATCNGKEMGFNGWYAQGQAYAYIHGGIYFLGGRVAEVTAGAVLEVKLPNPTWVRGQVVFHLNILNIIEGSFSRTIEKGSLCDNMKMDLDPFVSTKLIKKVTPEDKTKSVNPLNPEIRVDFTYAGGGAAPIKIYNTYTETYDYYYATNEVKLQDKDKKTISNDVKVVGLGKYPHKSFSIEIEKTLQPNTDYYIYARSNIDGEKEEKIWVKFTTGDRPAKFGMKDLYESYPLPNQRFFMKEQPNGNPTMGFLSLKQDLAYLFESGGVYICFLDKGGHLAGYEQASGYTKDTYDGKPTSKVSFKIPASLKNSTIYEVKLLAPDSKGGMLGEVIFDGFYFQTSKYNNFKEKLNTFKIVKTGYVKHTYNLNFNAGGGNSLGLENNFYVPVLMMQGGEELDGYEMFGYYTTVNDDKLNLGKLLFAYNDGKYLSDVNTKYIYYKNPKNSYKIDELSESEVSYMADLTNNFSRWTSRPAGFPFNGVEMAEMFSGQYPGEMFWMKSISFYEPILKKRGDLSGNEKIVGPIGPLTSDEINGGGGGGGLGGMVNNKLGNNNAPATKYYALMDYTPFIAAWDHLALMNKILNEAKKKSGKDLNKTYNFIKKMGIPKMPSGQQKIILGGVGSGTQSNKELTYNYNPPQ